MNAWRERRGFCAADHGRNEAAVTLSARGPLRRHVTHAGWTARLLATKRPQALVIAATARPETARALALWRGVVPTVCSLDGDIETVITRIVEERSGRLPCPLTILFVEYAGIWIRAGQIF